MGTARVLRDLTPPALWRLLQRLRVAVTVRRSQPNVPEWEYVPEGWAYERRHADIKGYTYSLAGYVRLFRRHGFATLSASYPRPDYVQPRHVQRPATDLQLGRPWYRLWAQIVAQRARWRAALVGRSFTFVARRP